LNPLRHTSGHAAALRCGCRWLPAEVGGTILWFRQPNARGHGLSHAHQHQQHGMPADESLPLTAGVDDPLVYERTQRSRWGLALAVGTLPSGFLAYSAMRARGAPRLARTGVAAVCALSALVGLDCAALRVRVTRAALSARFLFGWPGRRVSRADVVGVDLARPSPLAGWGYRWLGPGKVLFRVSGLDAVRVALRDGSVMFVGTDDPVGLKQALESE
jgi:hypothetical protein